MYKQVNLFLKLCFDGQFLPVEVERKLFIVKPRATGLCPLGSKQVKTFLLLQQTAVQSSILMLSHAVDGILQTCSVVNSQNT